MMFYQITAIISFSINMVMATIITRVNNTIINLNEIFLEISLICVFDALF